MRYYRSENVLTTTEDIEAQTEPHGLDFYLFVAYLTFIFWNPQNLMPAIQILRPALVISVLALVFSMNSGHATGTMRFTQSKLLALLVGFSFVATLQSIDFDTSLSYWLFFVKAMFLYYLFVSAMANPQRMTTVLWIMLILMFIDVALSLVMQKLYIIGYRLRSFDGDGGSNDYALMILSMMPFALHFMEHAKEKKAKLFSGACLLAFLLALTRTRSRMGFVGLILLTLQVVWAKRKKPVIVLVVLGLIVVALINTHFRYFQRIENLDTPQVQSSRTKLWKQAAELIQLRPWFGVGPGNFILAKQYFAIPGDKTHVAHNAFLELGAENGLMALSVYILIALVSLKNLLYAEKHFKGKDDKLYSISQAARIGYIVLLVSMLALSQQYNHFFLIFAAMSARLKYLAGQYEPVPDEE